MKTGYFKKTRKKALFLCVLMIISALTALNINAFAATDAHGNPFEDKTWELSSGNSAVIYNVETHSFLYDEDGSRRVPAGVTAKLMSCMIIEEKYGDFTKKIKISSEALKMKNIGKPGDVSAPRLGIKAGEEMSVKDLFNAALISSANDAVCALAFDAYDGNMKAFVDEMNDRAEKMGCKDTFFTGPAGVFDGEAYTTARDSAVIAGEFYNRTKLAEIAAKPTYQLGKTMHTKNYLLSEALMKGCKVKGAKGMAAGQSAPDGQYCVITSAQSEALTYIFVVTDGAAEQRNPDGTREFPKENAYADIKKLLPRALTSFGYKLLLSQEEVITEIPVSLSSDTDYVTVVPAQSVERILLKDEDVSKIKRKINIEVESLTAPVEQNMKVGTLVLLSGEKEIARVDLVTKFSADKSEVLSLFDQFKAFLHGNVMKWIIIGLCAIIVIFVVCEFTIFIVRIVRKIKRKKSENENEDGDDDE